jgi:type III pantothenate kinase
MAATDAAGSLFALDVGNTSVKCALVRGGQVELLLRVATLPVPGLRGRLREALDASGADVAADARCVISSVCPAADRDLTVFFEQLGRRLEFFGRSLAVPLPMAVREPGKVGIDRLLVALGALEEAGAPCIVASAGTAITVDLVDEGRFAGGAIAPGLGMSARALRESTALLPYVEPAAPHEAVGTDTASAITNGVYWACAGGIAALATRYRQVPGCESAPLLCTGTDAPLLMPALPSENTRDAPDLIFRGMARAVAEP